MKEALQNFIDELKEKQDEAKENGELETLFQITMMLGNAEDLLKSNRTIRWLECGLCHGSGKQKLYEDEWECPACLGLGGNFN